MNKRVVVICVAVLVSLLLLFYVAKTLKLLLWLLAAIGLYAVYSVVTDKVENLKRKF
ncbi:hypothetical protein R0J87_09445 [Halomonas sp. SIMBA_159]